MFFRKVFKNKVTLSVNLHSVSIGPLIWGATGGSALRTAPSGLTGSCLFFSKSLLNNKVTYYWGWKSQLGSVLWKSTDIWGKMRAVPGWQHHLDSQKTILHKSLLKQSYSQVWKWQPGSVIRGKAKRDGTGFIWPMQSHPYTMTDVNTFNFQSELGVYS